MAAEKILLAQDWKTGCYTEITPPGGGDPIKVATIKGFECIFANILNIVVRFAGIALFLMFLVGGFKYLTSGGDPKKSQAAQQTLTYAIIGLVVILGAWIIFLLIKEFTGVDVLNFEIVTGQ
ncbi:MAG: hypothetical protein BWY24_00282 [Microgenomates group bacterium ADurb.Bin219]|nr:MAG: hypothetical protein BWY24_00282 [Microgenomates group bacterium ADurb.Bin219]HNP89406.1 pilin [Candidatus Woesebacteria bacterium]